MRSTNGFCIYYWTNEGKTSPPMAIPFRDSISHGISNFRTVQDFKDPIPSRKLRAGEVKSPWKGHLVYCQGLLWFSTWPWTLFMSHLATIRLLSAHYYSVSVIFTVTHKPRTVATTKMRKWAKNDHSDLKLVGFFFFNSFKKSTDVLSWNKMTASNTHTGYVLNYFLSLLSEN